MTKLRKSLDTEHSIRFWLSVEASAYRVSLWPAWKRAGVTKAQDFKFTDCPIHESVCRIFHVLAALT